MTYSRLIAVGSYLPKKRLSNTDLRDEYGLDTNDEWIKRRTGIDYRHIADENEFCSDLGVKAAQIALNNAELTANDIDLIIVATTTPDHIFPATATMIQAKLGVPPSPAFDVQAVCAGFVYALQQADNMLRLGQASRALVIGAETYSRILDWKDRGTAILFGDGAGAVILEAVKGEADEKSSQVIDNFTMADGRHYEKLFVDGGSGSNGKSGFVRMEGKEVYKHAVINMSEAVKSILTRNGFGLDKLDWLIPHQANQRIIKEVGNRLQLPDEKVIITVMHHANTSAATIPLALHQGVKDSKFKKGDLMALVSLGGGFAWGASLLRW